jgi:hypothetical protein
MRLLIASLVLCATAHAGLAATVGTVHDAERGFSFTVPEGYTDYPEGREPGVAHAFARGKPDDASFMLIQIQGMGGTIGRESLVREEVEGRWRDGLRARGVEPTRFDLRKVTWKGFDLDLFVSHFASGDKKLVSLVTQVPLKKAAIQVRLMGAVGDEAKVSADLQAILASLDGPSSWYSDDERVYRLAELVGMVVGGLGVYLGLRWWRRRRRAHS